MFGNFALEKIITIFVPLTGETHKTKQMAGVNEVILVGRVGQDPERKEMNGGKVLVKFSFATDRKFKDKSTGERRTETQWHRIEAWDALAETMSTWVKKGQSLYIRGGIHYGKYEKDGVTHYTTSIVARDFQMLGGKSENGSNTSDAAESVRDYKSNSEPEMASAGTVSASSKDVVGGNDDVDDLPF